MVHFSSNPQPDRQWLVATLFDNDNLISLYKKLTASDLIALVLAVGLHVTVEGLGDALVAGSEIGVQGEEKRHLFDRCHLCPRDTGFNATPRASGQPSGWTRGLRDGIKPRILRAEVALYKLYNCTDF